MITPANRPPLIGDPDGKDGLFAFRLEALQNDQVRYANQPIALVVAETLEAATEGAALLNPRYEVEPARPDSTSDVSSRKPWGSARPRAPRMAMSRRHCRSAAQHRRDLRNALAIPQRDGAARHRCLMGGRPADARHAEPGAVLGPRSLRRLLWRPAGTRADLHAVYRRRLRIESDPCRGSPPVRARGPHDGPASEIGADASPDVRAGRPSRPDATTPAARL